MNKVLKTAFIIGFSLIIFVWVFVVSFLMSGNIKTKATAGPTSVDLAFNGITPPNTQAGNLYTLNIVVNRASTTIPMSTVRVTFSYSGDAFNDPVASAVVYSPPFVQSAAGTTTVDTVAKKVTIIADWPRDPTTGALQAQTASSMIVAIIPFPIKNFAAGGQFNFTNAEIVGEGTTGIQTITVEGHDPLVVGTGGTGGGTGTPTATPTPLPTGTVQLNMKLKFQGIGKKPADAYNDMKVKVTVQYSNNDSGGSQTGDFTSDANGVWSGSVNFNTLDLTRAVRILVKGPKHIQKKICDTKPTETSPGTYTCGNSMTLVSGANALDFSGIILLAGDLPVGGAQDGVVNSTDTSFIRNNLGSTDPSALAVGDINLDGKIDTQDWSLIIGALSVKADEQ